MEGRRFIKGLKGEEMNKTAKDEIMGALAYCWVLGWYAGRDGATTDEGKIKSAEHQLELLMERLGFASQKT